MDSSSLESAGYRLRAVSPPDLETVLHHRLRMFIDMGFDPAASESARQANTDLFQRALEEGRYRGFFVEDSQGSVVAGGGVVTHEFHTGPREIAPRRSWIVNVYTEPQHRRRGLARAILGALVDLGSEEGWAAVFLHASDEGRALYESLGFKATNEMVMRLK